MDEKIIPDCRYGHGNLMRQNADSGELQHYIVDTFPRKFLANPPNSFAVYSFVIYKCPICTYMELHDEA